jgi:hypothetical protein
MIAFRIKLNGRKIATAGLPGHHVLSAIASSVVRSPEAVKLRMPRRLSARALKFELGGLWTAPDGAREHVSWTNILSLKPGDRLSLEVVETDRVDEPSHRQRTDPTTIEAAEKLQLQYLKKKYARSTRRRSGGRHNKPLQRTALTRRR